MSKRSALITIVELVEQFIQKLGCELALADKGHSNLTSAVVNKKIVYTSHTAQLSNRWPQRQLCRMSGCRVA